MGYDLAIIAQEQIAHTESLGELRRALSEVTRRLEAAEQEIAALRAGHVCDCGCVTVTPAPVWQGVP